MTTNPFITKLSHLGLLQISGPDAKQFLQGQLTCDLNELQPGTSSLGAHCNPQGRMISLFRIFQIEHDYFLQMPVNLIPIAFNALKKYAVFFKVKLEDVSESKPTFGYRGEQKFQNAIQIPGTEPRSILFNSPENVEERPRPSWKAIDFHNKIPELYPETSEKFLPHEINLPELNGVSFKKGCYTGQEIIARMEYRGKLKKSLQLITRQCTESPVRGADLLIENTPTVIIDFYLISDNNYHLLILVNNV